MKRENEHVIQHYDPEKWCAVAANNGGNGPTWQWENEILNGFTMGTYGLTDTGHQTRSDTPFVSWLARSVDGGRTWRTWEPDGYAGKSAETTRNTAPIDFTSPGFVLRVEGAGYHGNNGARWFFSDDRGESWKGPFGFGGLLEQPELAGKEFTGRTAYIVNGAGELFIFLSVRVREDARKSGIRLTEKTFMAKSVDGGRSFVFVSWIIPWSDPNRAVMPAPVRDSDTDLVVTLRRKSETNNWIDCYGSSDNGITWSFRSAVGHTEEGSLYNGNPPSMVKLSDGRLCCAYGNRSERKIVVRLSADSGVTWSTARILRDDFHSVNDWPDLGYCRLFQRPDGLCVTNYFWCTAERPQTHIAVTIFDP